LQGDLEEKGLQAGLAAILPDPGQRYSLARYLSTCLHADLSGCFQGLLRDL